MIMEKVEYSLFFNEEFLWNFSKKLRNHTENLRLEHV